ncbi:H-NS histone family protein [Bradyrhizobium canariense]|uniref:H-NS histone family protein n=1 Tax=Bradyrhizobium canariense TaxID=255045 RepID=UPI001C6812C9|nr:H-NS histone family protein [Bradyrhizobium canariense]MBW5440517.1 H-NS histone family protein [Bradyrhizobium canariense]
MNIDQLKLLSLDELFKIRDEVTAKLTDIMLAEKARLEERQRRIGMAHEVTRFERTRRQYPAVHPKYRNPNNPTETWSGRGRVPRWLKPQLRGGRKLDDFLIVPAFD